MYNYKEKLGIKTSMKQGNIFENKTRKTTFKKVVNKTGCV